MTSSIGAWIHWSPVNSLHKGQWQGALMLSLSRAWMNGWINNREAGILRRHGAHCDVTAMVNAGINPHSLIIYPQRNKATTQSKTIWLFHETFCTCPYSCAFDVSGSLKYHTFGKRRHEDQFVIPACLKTSALSSAYVILPFVWWMKSYIRWRDPNVK